MYSISIDIDWAPDPLIVDARDLLDRHGIPATFFKTHSTDVDLGNHEVAVHPNIEKALISGQSIPEVLQPLRKLAPRAVGVRGHSLYSSTRFYPHYRQAGFEYESGHLCYGVHHLTPYWMIGGIVQVPMFWEDDLHLELARQNGHRAFSLSDLDLETPGLKVFVFHPIHLWINMVDLAHYELAKPDYQNPEALMRFRHHGEGTRTFFLELLSWMKNHHETVKPLCEIAATWRQAQRR